MADIASTEDTSSRNDQILQNEGIRDHLVETAVKFLTSPKIIAFDEEKKVNFLEKKGLTKAEIEASLSKSQNLASVSSTYAQDMELRPQYQVATIPALHPPAIPPRRSYWSVLRGSANIFIFISGLAYGLHYLYKNYIGPYLTGRKPKSSEDMFLEVHHSVMTVLQQIQTTLEKMDNNISSHNQILKDITNSENIVNRMRNPAMDDIQKELNNIKGLLINKKSFPAPPQVTPVIPHWQRLLKNEEDITPISKKEDIKEQVHINGDLQLSSNESTESDEINCGLNQEDTSEAIPDEIV